MICRLFKLRFSIVLLTDFTYVRFFFIYVSSVQLPFLLIVQYIVNFINKFAILNIRFVQ
jgi:hypothetical protein